MHEYRLGIDELEADVGTVSGGTSILVAGPPLSGKRAIIYTLAEQGLKDGEGVIIIPTMETGESVLSAFGRKNIKTDDLTIIDCMEERKGRPVRLLIDSLSTLLMYSSLQAVFRFVHLLNGRIRATGGLGIGVIDEGMHDDRTIAAFRQLYEAAIEIKETESSCLVRAVGLTPRPTSWHEIGLKRMANE
jgi:hypothetical protein